MKTITQEAMSMKNYRIIEYNETEYLQMEIEDTRKVMLHTFLMCCLLLFYKSHKQMQTPRSQAM